MPTPANRRQFLKSSTAAAVTAGTLATLPVGRSAHAAGDDVLKVGLVGCGGRGSGAASQALRADSNCKLVAMADAFEDRLEASLKRLKEDEEINQKIDVPKEQRFVGLDAYQKLIETDVDVVLLATPPGFRPLQLEACVKAGKHVFAEKPVAVDAPGVRKVLEICEQAKKKQLSIVSGLCLRYSYGFRETIKRLHDGQMGNILNVEANDYRGPLWLRPPEPGDSEMKAQIRNWYYHTWLSGDFNVEQHVHYLDISAWIMGGYPDSAIGLGGRIQRTEEKFGQIFDHHAVCYQYEDGRRVYSYCRQQRNCKNRINCLVSCAEGFGEVSERRLRLGSWKYDGKKNNIYQTEHDELFASIRDGKPINNGEYMSKSTLMAILGRMVTYTGKEITWDEALNSKEDLSPPSYDWNAELPAMKKWVPGVTEFS